MRSDRYESRHRSARSVETRDREGKREKKKESVELFTLLFPSVYNFPRSFEIFRIEGIKFYKVSRE